MKILMVTRESTGDKKYGLGKSLTPIIAALEQQGAQVGYLSQADVGERGVKVLQGIHKIICGLFSRFFTETAFNILAWGILERLNMGRLAAKVMAREQYTHVHCHDPIIAAGYHAFARLRWVLQGLRGHSAHWGITQHGFGSYTQAFHEDGVNLGAGTMRWMRNWETKIVLKAHWVLSPTHLGLKQLSRDLAIYPRPKHWYAIPHPCPVLKHYAKTAARQQLHWAEHKLYILAVGRVVELKQFPALLEACAKLSQQNYKIVLTGEGERGALQALAENLGIADRLEFSLSSDMGLYYAAADIYVSTSLTESFGLANLEAVSCGLPAICTAVGGVPEVVGQGAWLIPASHPQALFTALQALCDDASLRAHWQQQALQWVQTLPTAASIAANYLRMYRGESLIPPPALEQRKPINLPHAEAQTWAACPLPTLLSLPDNAKILMIAPHPDDEVLGCGGTLALLKQRGCTIKIVIVTDGGAGDPLGYSEDVRHTRQQESLAAMRLMGIEDVVFLNAPDSAYQHTPEIQQQFQQLFNEFQADWILFPSVLDYHRDHVAISLSVLETWQQLACRERLFCYETWATVPATCLVDISSVFELKMQAIQCYELPLRYGDYLTACRGMATYRGLYFMDGNSAKYAEAFLEITPQTWRSTLQQLWNLRRFQEQRMAEVRAGLN